MIIRITTRLGEKIHVKPEQSFPADANPFADWTAHLFFADRDQYIIITNTLSLYSMVMSGRGITNGSIFLEKAVACMFESLHADGFRFIFDRVVSPATAHISFSKTLNRSVTGSMNDLVHQAKYYLIDDQVPFVTLSSILNKVPMSYINNDSPRDVFMKLRFEQ